MQSGNSNADTGYALHPR